MKATKLTIASILALVAVSASAIEVGVTTTTDYSEANKRSAYGVNVGEQFGKASVAVGFERFSGGENSQDRYSVTAGYDIAKFGPVTLTPKLAVAYLNNQTSEKGYALAPGVGASVSLTKTIDLTVDASRQYGQDRVRDFDGNAVVVGLKTKF